MPVVVCRRLGTPQSVPHARDSTVSAIGLGLNRKCCRLGLLNNWVIGQMGCLLYALDKWGIEQMTYRTNGSFIICIGQMGYRANDYKTDGYRTNVVAPMN